MADPVTHPVMVKARELAEALLNSPEYKEGNEKRFTLLLTECNMTLAADTNINYGALGKSTAKSCC